MTTNILATVLTLFVTNTAVHWPQKQVPNPPHLPKPGEIFITDSVWTDYGYHNEDDTNADTRSTETTVQRQRLLCFEAEGRSFSETVTNETVAHYSVDERRTNCVIEEDIAFSELRPQHPELSLTNVVHYYSDRNGMWLTFLVATNWFEPVATNKLPLVAQSYLNTTFIVSPNLIWWGTMTNNAYTEEK